MTVIYDNFDFMKNKRDERIKNARTMHSIIMILLFENRKFDEKFLRFDRLAA